MAEEPNWKEFISTIPDFFTRIPFVNTTIEKLQAQSYDEFYERMVGVGLLLLYLGVISIFTVFFLENGNVEVFDFANTISIILITMGFWTLGSLVGTVNDPWFSISVFDSESRIRSLIISLGKSSIGALMIYWMYSEMTIGRNGFVEWVTDIAIAGGIVGVCIIAFTLFISGFHEILFQIQSWREE